MTPSISDLPVPPESRFDIALQGAPDEPSGVGVLYEAGGGGDSTRNADADGSLRTNFLLDAYRQRIDHFAAGGARSDCLPVREIR